MRKFQIHTLYLLLLSSILACNGATTNLTEVECAFSFSPLVGAYSQPLTFEVASTFIEQVEIQVVTTDNEPAPSLLNSNQLTLATEPGGRINTYTSSIHLQDGHHEIHVFDPCRGQWWKTRIWIDTKPPSVDIFPASGYYRPPLTININTSGKLLVRTYGQSLTPGTFSNTQSPITLETSGHWVVEALASDTAGNRTTAMAQYTLDATAPAPASLFMHSPRSNSNLLPRFDIVFDRPMDTEISVFPGMITQADGAQSHDVFAYWEDSHTAYIFPTDMLSPDSDFFLNLVDFLGIHGAPVIQSEQVFVDLVYSFTTASPLNERVFGSATVTTPSALIDASTSITPDIDLYLHLDPIPGNINLLSYRVIYDNGTGNTVLGPILSGAEPLDATTAKIELDTASFPENRSFALTLLAFDPVHEYTPDGYTGLYKYATTRDTNLPFTMLSAGQMPGAHTNKGAVLLAFNQIPAVNGSFTTGITAELSRDDVRIPISSVTAHYLPGSGGLGVQLAIQDTPLLDGDIVHYYGSAGEITDINGTTLSSDFHVEFTMAALPSTHPPFVHNSLLPGKPQITSSANRNILYLSHLRTKYKLTDWRFEIAETGIVLPVFRKPLASLESSEQSGDFEHHTFRTVTQMDPLPTGLELKFVASFENPDDSYQWKYGILFTVDPHASQKTDLGTFGEGAALRTPTAVVAIDTKIEFSNFSEQASGIDLTFPDLLPDVFLGRLPLSDTFQQAPLLPELPPNSENHPTHFNGYLLGDLSRTEPDNSVTNYGQLLVRVLPATAIPYVSDPVTSVLPATAVTTITWAVTDTSELQAISLRFYSTDPTGPTIEFRYPPSTTKITLHGADIAAGTYYWLPVGVSSVGDSFAFSRNLLDRGFAAATTRTITITP